MDTATGVLIEPQGFLAIMLNILRLKCAVNWHGSVSPCDKARELGGWAIGDAATVVMFWYVYCAPPGRTEVLRF